MNFAEVLTESSRCASCSLFLDEAASIGSDVVHCGRLKQRHVVQLGHVHHLQVVVLRHPGRQPRGIQALQPRHVVLVRQGDQPQQVRLLLPLLHPAVVEVVEQLPPCRQLDVLQLDPTALPLFHASCQQGLEDGRPFHGGWFGIPDIEPF